SDGSSEKSNRQRANGAWPGNSSTFAHRERRRQAAYLLYGKGCAVPAGNIRYAEVDRRAKSKDRGRRAWRSQTRRIFGRWQRDDRYIHNTYDERYTLRGAASKTDGR